MPTIIALGDSLTQGFQNGAIRRPEWSFPAMIARSFGLRIPQDYRVPYFGELGYPVDVERVVTQLEETVGDSLENGEWWRKLPEAIGRQLDEIEDYYERGIGSRALPFDGHYHNLAAWGFTVNEARTLTPAMCATRIAKGEGWVADDLFDVPAMPMHRAAIQVLNPAASPSRDGATMIENLRGLAEVEPIDMLILWLGSNDALGTVLTLSIADMPVDYEGDDPAEREAFNLTSVEQFRRDYTRLADEVASILSCNPGRRQVYVGTVPYVTIPPLTRGFGNLEGKYFDRYAWFFRDGEEGKWLTRTQAMLIDERIDGFNDVIREIVRAHGWTLVDTAMMLEQLAVRRNPSNDTGSRLRKYLESRGYVQHPLLTLDPIPCVSLYTVARGEDGVHRRATGGLFSLDHIHPSTIGYGLAAERFLEAMKANNPSDPVISNARIDWETVILQDPLIQSPPRLWDDLMVHSKRHPWLWDFMTCTLARKVL